MRIIIAPDSFKGSLTATEVATAIEQGLSHALPSAEIIQIPMADGGEGTLECFEYNKAIELVYTEVTGPLGERRQAPIGILKDGTAVIETAKACGLELVPFAQRNPLHTTTYGVGELIRFALDKGCKRFIIALGGSATCEGGVGALAALGAQLKDHNNQAIPYTGEGLGKLNHIDLSRLDPRLKEAEFILAHDVNNPLLGLEGALMYTPQKGATPEQVEILHKNLEHYAEILRPLTSKEIYSKEGTGAAGGLSAGLYAFLHATLEPGAAFIMQAIAFRDRIQNAHLIITGEGQIDAQTVRGKTPIAVAKCGKEFKIPVIAIAARLGVGSYAVYDHGIDAIFSIVNGPITEKTCLVFTKPLLSATANNIGRLLALRIH